MALHGLKDENENTIGRGEQFSRVRMNALRLLGLMGPESKAAVPQLVRFFREEYSPYSLTAAVALYRIGEYRDEALSRLKENASSHNPRERRRVVHALGELAPGEPEVMSLLEKATEDIDYEVREAALRQLNRIEDYKREEEERRRRTFLDFCGGRTFVDLCRGKVFVDRRRGGMSGLDHSVLQGFRDELGEIGGMEDECARDERLEVA